MPQAKKRIILCVGYGNYLGVNKKEGSFVLQKEYKIVDKVPFHLCSIAYVSDGNSISSDALFYAGVYGIDVVLMSQTGRLISMMRPLNTDFDADVRIAQYDAYTKAKGVRIAKDILLAKVQTQIEFLEKHKLDSSKIYPHIGRIRGIRARNLDDARIMLVMMEANCTKVYFHEYASLFGFEKMPSRKKANKHGAKDIFNNVLNLSYEVLRAECFRACYNAHLDPYLGYLHSTKHGKPALVCDLQEFFRVEINGFLYRKRKLIDYQRIEDVSGRKFLHCDEALKLITMLNEFLDSKRKTRIKFGTSPQYTRRSIIKFQARMIAGYLKGERKSIISI